MLSSEVPDPLLLTRRSLVERLGNPDDQASWRTFFDNYGGLLYRVARTAGLTDTEAQDAVQETVITVARNIGGLHYDPAVGSFKGWLLQTARWRIADQFRLRQRRERLEGTPLPTSPEAAEPRTALIDRVPDPDGFDLETAWDDEWRTNLLSTALARLRRHVDPKQFQIFDCYVTKGWPVVRVARELGSTWRRSTWPSTGSAQPSRRSSPAWSEAKVEQSVAGCQGIIERAFCSAVPLLLRNGSRCPCT